MDLNQITLNTNKYRITIQRFDDDWYFQVMTGSAATKHVETQEFSTYKEAVDYAFKKYGLVTD